MTDLKQYEFKGATADIAVEKGLKKLGLEREDAEVEIVNEGGIFTKALVRVVPKSAVEDDEREEESFGAEEETVGEANRCRDENIQKYQKSGKKYEKATKYTEEKEKGKEFIEGILPYIGDSVRVDCKTYDGEIDYFIVGENASTFIGRRGEILDSIQYLANQIINRGRADEERIRISIDADFYRERRIKTLTNLARKLAKKAYAEKREIPLEPMNSYERRIIHSALQGNSDATTRSEGDGKYRHVVIVPGCEAISYGNVSAEFRKKGPSRTKTYGGKKVTF